MKMGILVSGSISRSEFFRRHDGPPRWQRIVAGFFVAILSALICYIAARATHMGSRDFGQVWFGTRSLLEGKNPYDLIGPGRVYNRPWALYYPATALVAGIPLAWLREIPASLLFAALSGGLLAYGFSRDGWYRFPAFLSFPFIIASAAAQWSPLFTAAIVLPGVAYFLAAKPTLGAAIMATLDAKIIKRAIVGGAALLVISLALLPTWPRDWLAAIATNQITVSPVRRLGGFAILLAALRWRRPEARLLLGLALMPQTGTWYEALPVFWIASNRNESMILVITTSVGWLLQDYVMTARNEVEFNAQVGALMVAFAYLPAVWMVLRRANEGAGIFERVKRQTPASAVESLTRVEG